MCWEWSHTPEAHQNAKEQTFALPTETLLIILAENYTAKELSQKNSSSAPDFDEELYDQYLARFASLDHDTIAESVWAFAEEIQTCDNGGWNAHLCAYGCGCHTVPFDPVESEA